MAQEIAKAYVHIVPTTQDIQENIKKALNGCENEFAEVGEKAGKSFSEKLKGAILKAGIGAAITKTIKDAISNGAEFEQLFGGAEKIFEGMDISNILNDATQAYKDLGMSANEYLEKINDVGAAFKSTMGSQAGYDTARKGLKAISDYASGTGKNIETLSEKFTMITRSTSSYQSIADQFSGILPATSQAFLEQAKAAGTLSDSYTSLSQVPIDEYQRAVTAALEKGVDALGFTGKTAEEASTTLSGSVQEMKAAWENFTTSLVIPEIDSTEAFQALIDSFNDVVDNIVPMLKELAPNIANALADAFTKLAPRLLEIMISVFVDVVKSLPDMLKKLDLGGISVLVIAIGAAFLKIVPAIQAATSAMIAFQASAAGPYALIAVGIAAVAAAAFVATDKLTDMFLASDTGQELINKIVDLENEIDNAGGTFEWLKQKATDAGANIKQSLQDAFPVGDEWNRMTTNFSNAWERMKTTATSGAEALKSAINGALNSALDSVKGWGNNVIDAVRNAFNKMISTIQDIIKTLPQKIKEAGIQMAQGLVNGFTSRFESIKSKMFKSMEDVIEYIKKMLGIHSPSRVFADEIGAMMALGISEGFTGIMPKVNAEIQTDLRSTLGMSNKELRSALNSTPSGNISRNTNESLADDIATAIKNLTFISEVKLEGDSNKLFKVVQDKNNIYKKSTGRSAFA